MLTFLIFLIVVVIAGVLAGLLVRDVGERLCRNRDWIALVAVAGCLGWYPLAVSSK